MSLQQAFVCKESQTSEQSSRKLLHGKKMEVVRISIYENIKSLLVFCAEVMHRSNMISKLLSFI